jgi:hypothetical protein
VGDAPDQPGEEAAQVDPAKVDDSGLAPDGGKIAVVAIAERPELLGAAQTLISMPYSPYQNAKQEAFWGPVEGRL